MTHTDDPSGETDSHGMAEAERELVSRMKAGDERAFEEFADHYVPALYRFAAAQLRGEPDQVRDAVQATVCRGLEKLDTFRGESSLFTWLASMCRNEIAGHFRRRQRRPSVELEEGMTPAAGSPLPASSNPEENLLVAESGELVHRVLDALAPAYCAVLEWKYIENLPVSEIATRLNVGPKAAESLLGRARRAFRALYEEQARGSGVDHG